MGYVEQRDDISRRCQLLSLDGRTRLSTEVVATRSTRSLDTGAPTHTTQRIAQPAVDFGFDVPDLAAFAARLRRDSQTTSTEIVVTVQDALRRFRNSQGVDFEWRSRWCEMTARVQIDGYWAQVTDGTDEWQSAEERVGDVISALAARRSQSGLQKICVDEIAPTEVALAPTVAAVVLHELLGHGSEEAWRMPPDAVVNASTVHPRRTGFDDEGIPIRMHAIGGSSSATVIADRGRSPLASSLTPSGLAQAAIHGGPPHARCTHIEAVPATPLVTAPYGAIYCDGIAGAEAANGTAIVLIDSATRRARRGTLQRVQPFYLFLTSKDLGSDRAFATGPAVLGRSARCVKFGQSLPTQTVAPPLLICGVRTRPWNQ